MQKDTSLPELRFSTLQEFFKAVEKSPAFASLPVVKGELQHHARGCYSTYAEGKALNRRAERWLVESEAITLLARKTLGRSYPAEQYAESWWKVLFCQFHDMMAGTALYSDYEDIRDSTGYACEVAQTTKISALEAMAKQVDLSKVEEGAVFLFNPLPWKRKALVEYYTEKDPSGKAPITPPGLERWREGACAVAAFGEHDELFAAAFGMGGTPGMRIQGFRTKAWRGAGLRGL